MGEENIYEILADGNSVVTALCQKYPKIMWAVNPDQVVVLGITNRERPKKMRKLAVIRRVSPAMRTIISSLARKAVNFYIEVYCSDFITWSNQRRQWVILHELVHIPGPDEKGLIQHDTQDFAGILDSVGIDWWAKDSLPDLLDGPEFPFREELFKRLHIKDPDDDGEGRSEGGDSEGQDFNPADWS